MRMRPATHKPGAIAPSAGYAASSAIEAALEQVIASFEGAHGDADQVFVQPLLEQVALAGVAFSRAPMAHRTTSSTTINAPAVPMA